MSLVCWLPLNGNLNDNGCGITTITNSGATVNSSGKIGSCYVFDGTDDYIALSGAKLFNCFKGANQPFSVAMWILHADNTRAIVFGDYGTSGGVGFNIELYGSHVVRFYWNSSPDYLPSGMNVGTNVWHHIALTYDGSSLKSYLDGVLCATRSGALNALNKTTGEFRLGRDNRTGATALNGRLNDVRIYDNCLSQAEVHEISQGLVLHYKLDHLYKNFSTNNINTWANKVIGAYTGTLFSITMTNFINATGAKNGDTFTFSVDIKSNANTKRLTTRVQHYNSDSDRHSVISDVVIMPGQSGRSYVTFTLNTSYSQLDFMIHNIDSSTQTGNTTELYKCVQIEYGKYPSAWIPPGIAASAFDSSGYGHDGILNDTTARISLDTARYSAALLTSQTNNSATYPIKGECNIPESSNLTFTWWMKPTTLGHQISGIFSTSNSDATDYSSTAAHMRDSCFDCCNTSGTCVRINVASYLTTNEWHHYALTYNGSTLTFYKDGASKVTASQTGALKAFKYIFPFYSKAGGGNRTTSGYLSDFRIYCTTLSADDIKQLYEVGAKIDNHGNIHTYNLSEEISREVDAKFVNNSATSVTYDVATDTYTIVSPVGTSSWGYGIRLADTPALEVPYGMTYRWTAEVWTPVALTVQTDYNNTATTTWAGNDNDATSTRLASSNAIPANTWTRIYRGSSNTHASNTNHLSIRDYSSLGLVTNGQSGPVTWKVRHLQWYLVNTTFKPQIKKTGVFKAEHFTEVEQSLNKSAQFNKQMSSINGNEFIEI